MKILTVEQAKHIEKMTVWSLADYIQNNKIRTLVLGISGGLDSAVMAAIGLRTINLLEIGDYDCGYIFDFIDIESKAEDFEKALELSRKLGFNLGTYNYTESYRNSPIRLPAHAGLPNIKVANGNLKCRERMKHLYDRAQLYGGIVLDTDDLSELLMGFWTKHGDVGDVKLIQYLTKEEVRDLGEHLGVCQSILDSAPGDGLGVTINNKASDQLKMSYLKIDYVISRMTQIGLDINGNPNQLYTDNIWREISIIAKEINEHVDNVIHVIKQALKTAYKRVGDDAVLLIKDRTAMGLPELGSDEFNRIYLREIKK